MNEPVDLQDSHDDSGHDSAFGVLGIVARRKSFLLLGLAAGAALGYLYYTRQAPIYQSGARLLILKSENNLGNQYIGAFSRYQTPQERLSNHIMMIQSPLVVEQAVRDYELDKLPSFAGMSNPAPAILGGLFVEQSDAYADALDLSYRGRFREDCQIVLDAVMQSYIKQLNATKSVTEDTVKLIEKANKELLDKLAQQEKEYRDFRTTAPSLASDPKELALHQDRLQRLEDARGETVLAVTRLKSTIESIESAMERGADREALLLMVDRAGELTGRSGAAAGSVRDTTSAGIVERLLPLVLEEQTLLETYGADHPLVKSIRRKIETTREFLTSQLAPSGAAGGERKPIDFLAMYLESMRQELETISRNDRELAALYAEEEKAVHQLAEQDRKARREQAAFEATDESLRSDIARTQQLFDSVVKRLQEINIAADYGGYNTQVLSTASPAGQVEPNFSRIMTPAAILGLLFGFGLATLVDMADKSFRSPADICRQLRLPIVGHIPAFKTKDSKLEQVNSKLDGTLMTHYRSKSQVAEAYRAVRTALYFTTRGEGHKVVQITSPAPGDGKSTLAANLSICIAQSGKRVLLIDADFRRPRVHKLFSFSRDVGLSSVIGGEAELMDAVHTTEINNLFCLSCGPKVNNPSELLTLPRFKELIDLTREKFDFVVIDTPPMLAVTDPSIVAARVDG
ncbi:MAG: polysaccharide biosynthesis tyrosine autokinase, partial [Planctomycetes bacterium]|nr:polysaccharide biosynthesis tyrosine autokinase [Planctomycetota bacterium]